MAVVAIAVTAGTAYLKMWSLPLVDQAVSARPVWHTIADRRDQVCVEQIHRRYRYGLNYYAGTPLPECSASERPLHLVGVGGNIPALR